MAKPNLFNSVEAVKPKKNVFDLSHDVKMSTKMGLLTPSCVIECVPGDLYNIGCDSLVRLAPLLNPIMHRVDVTMHYFFVPNRLVWDSWERWIVNPSPEEALPYVVSKVDLTDDQKKFLDYLGIPPNNSDPAVQLNVNALPLAAYQMIYNEYYRDENLIGEVNFALNAGDNSGNADLFVQRLRAWEHDYFTGSLPFAQKGTAVDIPIGQIENDAPVRISNTIVDYNAYSYTPAFSGNNGSATATFGAKADNGSSTVDPNYLFVDGEEFTVSPTTINDLRRAMRLQEWLEKNARGGTRYIENILMHFGVKSSDARLQRPEYITGIKTPIIISEVLNTTGEIDGEPQGNMAGHGVAVQQGKYGKYFCEEHGYIIGIMSVMPKTAYQQGIPKTYLKTDPLDFFWPSFAHIGEQEVVNSELFAYTSQDADTFGYVPRYSEYKFVNSRVAGDFRTQPLYSWHLGRIFQNMPFLNQTFIECDPDDVSRAFAVIDPLDPNVDNVYVQILHKIRAVRCMPKFGTPTL